MAVNEVILKVYRKKDAVEESIWRDILNLNSFIASRVRSSKCVFITVSYIDRRSSSGYIVVRGDDAEKEATLIETYIETNLNSIAVDRVSKGKKAIVVSVPRTGLFRAPEKPAPPPEQLLS